MRPLTWALIGGGVAALAYASWKVTQPPDPKDWLGSLWTALGQKPISQAVASSVAAARAGGGSSSSSSGAYSGGFDVYDLVEDDIKTATATQQAVAKVAVPLAAFIGPTVSPVFQWLNSVGGSSLPNTSDPWASGYVANASAPDTSSDLNYTDQ